MCAPRIGLPYRWALAARSRSMTSAADRFTSSIRMLCSCSSGMPVIEASICGTTTWLAAARCCIVSGDTMCGKANRPRPRLIRRIGDPANEEATGLAAFEPDRQGHQVGGPLVALLIGNRGLAERAVQFAAQAGEEGRLSPARFEFLAHGDGGPAGDDVRVGALQGVEGHLQAEPKEPAGRAEEVVGCRGQQVDVGGVATDRLDDVAARRSRRRSRSST